MRTNWEPVADWIMQAEGGFVDDPRDPGGATKWGVTLRELRAVRGKSVTVADIRDLDQNVAKNILRFQYWEAVRGDVLPGGLDYCVADAAFNSGPVQAIRWLQCAVGIAADGHYGVVTAQAVRGLTDIGAAIDRYDAARLGMLRHLPTWLRFGRGWNNRVNLVSSRAHALAKAAS